MNRHYARGARRHAPSWVGGPRLLAVLVVLAAGLAGGCAGWGGRDAVRVTRAERPLPGGASLATAWREDDGRAGLIVPRPAELTAPNFVTFDAAREAYWNRDTATAVRLLRHLRDHEGIADDHFRYLVLQCYEQDDRWAETLELYREFGVEDEWRDWLEHARVRAAVPRRTFEFQPGSAAVPFALRGGDLVVAEVAVNGVKARVLVDTGANLSWWSRSFARRAGLESLERTVTLNDAHGAGRPMNLVVLRELQVGGMTARNVVGLTGWSFWWRIFLRVDGVIGWDVLQHANLVLDFPRRQMTVEAPGTERAAEPTLAGRVAPILTVTSKEGRPLQLLLDTGASDRRSAVTLYENEGVLGTRTALAAFRRSWRPVFSLGMHSLRVTWPQRAQPYSFWLDGFRFEVPEARLDPEVSRQEHFAFVDGLVGNGPFLGGTLTLCGVRRRVTFEPAAVASGVAR